MPECALGHLYVKVRYDIIFLQDKKAGEAMEEVLTIHLPSEILQMLNHTSDELARDVRLYAALMLFRLGKLSSGAEDKLARAIADLAGADAIAPAHLAEAIHYRPRRQE
jgi:predicted ATPase with chaperone activity